VRSRAASQALLHQFLKGCEVVALDETRGHRVGRLLARTRSSDIVDACVVELAAEHGSLVLTSDLGDLEPLIAAAKANIRV
jgi:hypothetical protein